MKYPHRLIEATLIKRYKRFLADVRLHDNSEITVHCPNTGKMTGCAEPGNRVWLLPSNNPKRKYSNTWELIEVGPDQLACIHSARANTLVKEAIEEGVIKELRGFEAIATETRFGRENSRIDLLLDFADQQCLVEVKCVTLHAGQGIGLFPDTVSARASKHLRELMVAARQGYRSVLCYCVLHDAIDEVRPACAIDPVYARTLSDAVAAGVEVLAYKAAISTKGLELTKAVPFTDNT